MASVGARARRRVRRRAATEAHGQADTIRLLHTVIGAVAGGQDADRVAAEGIRELLGAERVLVTRKGADGEQVTADVGATGQPPAADLPHLDAEGRIPSGHLRSVGGMLVLPNEGAVLDIVQRKIPVGSLIVIPREDQPVLRATRLGIAAIAHALAVTPRGPLPSASRTQPAGADDRHARG